MSSSRLAIANGERYNILPANEPTTSKVTLYIDKGLIRECKKHAIDENMSFSKLTELALMRYLESAKRL